MRKVYSGIDKLPAGQASDKISKGCLVLEGGSFRGLYTGGVTDALMLNDINLECTIGVSAGAMNGYNYVSGQIGRASRFNLGHRFDPNYVGIKAMPRNKGIFGFDLIFDDSRVEEPFNLTYFNNPDRRFIAVATDCKTGKTAYFEKGKCTDIFQAIRASASMPILSKMVPIDDGLYLDGGCSTAMGLDWALQEGYEKIIVVKTRDRSYRKPDTSAKQSRIQNRLYRKYPEFLKSLNESQKNYNILCDRIDELERQGRIFVIAPSEPVTVGRLERDMEKLGALYYLGRKDTEQHLQELLTYLDQ